MCTLMQTTKLSMSPLHHTQAASPVVPPAPVCQLVRCKQLCLIIRHAVEDVEECVLQAGRQEGLAFKSCLGLDVKSVKQQASRA